MVGRSLQSRVTVRVIIVHASIILVMLFMSVLKGCFLRKEKPLMMASVEFGAPPPSVAVEVVNSLPSPVEPLEFEEPVEVQESAPVEVPSEVPERQVLRHNTPVVPPKVKKKDPVKKTEPVKKTVKKKKSTLKKASEIDTSKSRVIQPREVKPALTSKEIEKALTVQSPSRSGGSSSPTQGRVGSASEDASYVSQIGRFFDSRWSAPSGLTPTRSTIVAIYISKWGTITKRVKVQSSGDATFDASVMKTVQSVSAIPRPPDGFPYSNVEVEFRITSY